MYIATLEARCGYVYERCSSKLAGLTEWFAFRGYYSNHSLSAPARITRLRSHGQKLGRATSRVESQKASRVLSGGYTNLPILLHTFEESSLPKDLHSDNGGPQNDDPPNIVPHVTFKKWANIASTELCPLVKDPQFSESKTPSLIPHLPDICTVQSRGRWEWPIWTADTFSNCVESDLTYTNSIESLQVITKRGGIRRLGVRSSMKAYSNAADMGNRGIMSSAGR